MKRTVSLLLTLALLAACLSSLAAGYEGKTKTLEHSVVGTLNSSGCSYEGKIKLHNYIGALKIKLPVGEEKEEAEIAVVLAGADPAVEVEMKRFSGHIYGATLSVDEYHYSGGSFEKSDEKAGRGASGLTRLLGSSRTPFPNRTMRRSRRADEPPMNTQDILTTPNERFRRTGLTISLARRTPAQRFAGAGNYLPSQQSRTKLARTCLRR